MISIIAALDRNGLIGKNNDLPWRLPADLAYFKKVTTGSSVVMGRKTYESIGNPLPNRKNIIITRNANFQAKGCTIIHSIDELVGEANFEGKDKEFFIIGGANIYGQALPVTKRLYLTYIDEAFEGDTYFPEVNLAEWDLISNEKGIKNNANPYDYYFRVYQKKD